MQRKISKKSKLYYPVLAVILIVCILRFWGIIPENNSVSGEMGAYFVDVGQGDCSIIKTRDSAIIIDAGVNGCETAIFEVADALGIGVFDYAIFTHPHTDHIGSAAEVLGRYKVKNVIMPNAVTTTKTFERMLDAIDAEGCNVIEGRAGTSYTVGSKENTVKIDVIAPVNDYDDLNNMSVVTRITYGNVSFLFTGDAETLSERDILDSGARVKCDVLKVGHHGSKTSTSKMLLSAADPSIAVICVGNGNDYGHPHKETVSRLDKSGISIYRTDLMGTVAVITDGKNIRVETEIEATEQ